ncbi:MAG TPA: Hsp20/alpha crystallin family protein [Pirellulaceae bacterium]
MQIVRWDPFQQLVAMNARLNRTANDPHTLRAEGSFGAWAPPVDIFEKNERLVIRAEIPGVQKEDMDVGIENGVLTLHGERKQATAITEENAYRMERVYGMFTRSFTLPTTVDAARVTASYKDGVLEVTVPKIETAKSKRVEINAS